MINGRHNEMARTMTTSRRVRLSAGRKSQKTKLDRLGQRLLDESSKDSLVDERKVSFSPREGIVRRCLRYILRAKTEFKGDTPPDFEKTYKSDEDVLEDFQYADLTFMGYRGFFGMMLLRNEFPSGLFVLKATLNGPRLELGESPRFSRLHDNALVLEVLRVCA
jgi:hypothetical protein